MFYVLIGLMQLGTRCSDGSCQAHEDLIAGFSAIEAEAELVQVRLKLCAATVICAEQNNAIKLIENALKEARQGAFRVRNCHDFEKMCMPSRRRRSA